MGEVIFRDKEGNLYRDVDAKGIGHLRRHSRGLGYRVAPVEGGGEGPWRVKGLLESGYAHTDRYNSEMLIENGIRTYRTVAIVELKELIVEGKKITVKEARKTGLIPIDFVPVVAIRAYPGTRERIESGPAPQERRETALGDAATLVAQELGKDPEEFSAHEYLTWFAETLGRQVAKLRKLGLHHGYITPHNTTLDCRIIDLDSVARTEQKISEKRKRGNWFKTTAEGLYSYEAADAKVALDCLVDRVRAEALPSGRARSSLSTREDYKALFDEAYQRELQAPET